MSVIPGMPEPAEASGPARPAPFDLLAVSGFLRNQANCLRHGLEHADDPDAVQAVLRAHDAGHESWLRLIASVEALCPEAADVVAGLYGFHGRIAGALERRAEGLACPSADRTVRTLLGARLRSRTDEALRRLRTAGARAGHPAAGA